MGRGWYLAITAHVKCFAGHADLQFLGTYVSLSNAHTVFKNHEFAAVGADVRTTWILLANIGNWRFFYVGFIGTVVPFSVLLDGLHDIEFDFVLPVHMAASW